MKNYPTTIAIALSALAVNVPWLIDGHGGALAYALQQTRAGVESGEYYRLLTGNLVHWSAEHFLLDVAAIAIIGWLFEARQRASFFMTAIASAAFVGVCGHLFVPEMPSYRGLSGIASGLFALGIVSELREGSRSPFVWVAGFVFASKIAFEMGTGGMFFGTESFGDMGVPLPLAHAAGAGMGLLVAILAPGGKSSESKDQSRQPSSSIIAAVFS